MSNVVMIKPTVAQEDDVCIEVGSYKVVYAGHKSYSWRNGMKLRVLFRIIEGEHEGVVLARHYNIDRAKPSISAKKRSDLVREIQQVTERKIARTSRISIGVLAQHIIAVDVRTVNKAANGDQLHKINQYSVIGSVKGCVK